MTSAEASKMQSKTKWTLVYVPPSAPWSRMEFDAERAAQWQQESLIRNFPGMKAHLRILPPARVSP